MIMVHKCCVPGCSSRYETVHRFPRYDQYVSEEWFRRIFITPIDASRDSSRYKKYVCDKHFSDFNRDPGSKRLRMYSVPTINLPGFNRKVTKENSFCYRFSHIHPSDLVNFIHNVHRYTSRIPIKTDCLKDCESWKKSDNSNIQLPYKGYNEAIKNIASLDNTQEVVEQEKKIVDDVDDAEKGKIVDDVDNAEKEKIVNDVDAEKEKIVDDVGDAEEEKIVNDVDYAEEDKIVDNVDDAEEESEIDNFIEVGEIVNDNVIELGEIVDDDVIEVGEIVKGIIDLHNLPYM